MVEKKRLRPICYERVSSKVQVDEGYGLEDQRTVIDRFLDKNTELFTNDREYYTDKGVSAFKNSNISKSSELGKFLDKVEKNVYGDGDALICTSLDRLTRRSAWSENTIQFIVNSGIVVFDISTNVKLHRDDPMSKILMEIIIQRAHNESLMKSIRAKEAWDKRIVESAGTGNVISSRIPMWLENIDGKYAVKQKEASLVVKCFEWYVQGLSTGEIVKRINDKQWQMITVSRLIRDKRLLGEHTRYSGEVVRNVYPVIVDGELFAVANRMMDVVASGKKRPVTDMVLVPEVVKKVFSFYDNGAGSGSIVKKLLDLGISWSTVDVLRVLRDKRVVQDKIIDNLTFERIQSKLNKDGIATKIRRDIKIAKDDYITNLFPRILRCGCCGGNTAIHYNHVRAKYIICRTREERKQCDHSKSIQYIRIEKHILEKLKNVDFSKLVMNSGSKINELDTLKTELAALRIEEQQYIDEIKKRRSEGKRSSAVLDSGLVDVQDSIDDIQMRIDSVDHVGSFPTLDFNIDDALKPTNVELRAKIRNEIKQVVRRITYKVVEKNIFVGIEYFTDVIRHLLVIRNKKDNVLEHDIVIFNHNGTMKYETSSFSLEVTGDELILDIPESVNITDYSILLNYVDGLDGSENVANWMREHFDEVLLQKNAN